MRRSGTIPDMMILFPLQNAWPLLSRIEQSKKSSEVGVQIDTKNHEEYAHFTRKEELL
jgi:hypothetical protein